MDDPVGKRINSIKTDSQTHHIQADTRITFCSGCIADMAQYLMLKSLLQAFPAERFGINITSYLAHKDKTSYNAFEIDFTQNDPFTIRHIKHHYSSDSEVSERAVRCTEVTGLHDALFVGWQAELGVMNTW